MYFPPQIVRQCTRGGSCGEKEVYLIFARHLHPQSGSIWTHAHADILPDVLCTLNGQLMRPRHSINWYGLKFDHSHIALEYLQLHVHGCASQQSDCESLHLDLSVVAPLVSLYPPRNGIRRRNSKWDVLRRLALFASQESIQALHARCSLSPSTNRHRSRCLCRNWLITKPIKRWKTFR